MPFSYCPRSAVLLLLALLAPAPAHALGVDCQQVSQALRLLNVVRQDPDARSQTGACLIQLHIDHPEVAKAVIRILRDPREDILLKEDLIAALAESPLRRKVRVESQLAGKPLAEREKEAMERNVGSVGAIIAAAQAVQAIEETVPVTQFEADFFRVLSDIALDDSSHVLLRTAAVRALERLSTRVVRSGIIDEKSFRVARDALHIVANRDDVASYLTEAGPAYSRLADAGMPGYLREFSSAGRMISSIREAKDK
jgi:hypothetical protein